MAGTGAATFTSNRLAKRWETDKAWAYAQSTTASSSCWDLEKRAFTQVRGEKVHELRRSLGPQRLQELLLIGHVRVLQTDDEPQHLAGDERSGRDRGAISNGRRRETHESGPRRCAAQRRHSSSVRFVPHRLWGTQIDWTTYRAYFSQSFGTGGADGTSTFAPRMATPGKMSVAFPFGRPITQRARDPG